jgi:alkylation response protein AidB-like acyl-CoA dehydrogenase
MKKLGAKGWLAPALPKEYGGMGADHVQRVILEDEMGYHFAAPLMVGNSWVGPTIHLYGNEEQKREYLPRLARGEIEFTLGYSEPQAGSDLAALDIRAVKDGDDYILNGQKIFNTNMHYSNYVWLAARTDPDVPKHKGISLMVVDSKSPGITIRPMWTLDGERTNEVFYDNVRVPQKNVVGEENKGWYYLNTALAFERNFPIGRSRRLFEDLVAYCQETEKNGEPLSKDPLVRQSLADLKVKVDVTNMLVYIGRSRRLFEDLVAYCQETEKNGEPLSKDPLVRQSLADLKVKVDVTNMLVYWVAWMADKKIVPEWQSPIVKILSTELMYSVGNTGMQVMGLYGLLNEGSKWAPLQGRCSLTYRQGARRSITAGTQEIQRTVIALRGLGLPRN